MKKKFTFLIAALMLLTMVLPWRAVGQTTSYSLTPDNASTGSSATAYITTLTEFTYNSVSWKMNQWNPKTLQIKCNQANAANEFRFYNTSAFPGRITQVVITFSAMTVSNENGLMFCGGTSEVSATSGGTAGTWNGTAKTLTWTPGASDNYTFFAFYQNGKAASGTNYLASSNAIVVTYETGGGGGSTTYTVTYNGNGNTSGTVPTDSNEYDEGDEVTVLGEGNLAKEHYEFVNWNTAANGTGDSYEEDDTFEISANTTLYAIWAINTHDVTMPGEDEYGSYSASATSNVPYGTEVTLTYTPASGLDNYVATWSVNGDEISGNSFPMPDEAVTVTVSVEEYVQPTEFDIDLNNSLFGTSYTGAVSDITDANPVVGTQDNVTVTYAGSGNHYINNSQIRFYPNNKLTFDAPTGYVVKKIVFTAASSTWAATISANTGTYNSDTKTWEGTATSVLFTGSGSSRCDMSKVAITLDIPATNYDINYADNLTNGSFASGNPTSAAEDETVIVTTVPAAGYHLATMTYNYGEISENATISGNTGSFAMPADDILVYATFAENVAAFTNGVYSEPMTTQASFDNMAVFDNNGDQTWEYNSSYKCAYINGHVNSTNNANVDWLVTPKMAVSNGKLDIAFESWHNSYGAGQLSVKWATSLNGTWTNLDFTEGDASSWNTSTLTITTDAANVYVAFVYTSTSESAGTWELKNFTAKQYYNITLSATNGNIMSDPEDKAAVGSTVELAAFPDENYHFVSWSILPVSVTITDDTFVMPAEAVTVSTTFEQDVTYTITFVENRVEKYSDDVTSGLIGDNLPSTTFGSVPANLAFVGWSTSEIMKYQTADPAIVDASYNVTGNVTFYAVYKYDYSYTTGGGTPAWTKVTDDSTLAAGDQLVIASEDGEAVAGDISSQLLGVEDAEFNNGIMTSHSSNAVEFVLGGEEDAWTFENEDGNKLGATAAKKMAWDNGTTTWSISINEGNATIANTNTSYGSIQYNYNQGNPRFTSYTSTQGPVQLYRLEGGSTPVSGTYYLTSVTEITANTTINTNTTLSNNVTVKATGADAGSYTITGTGKLNANGYLIINEEPDRFVINHGGQLVCSNAGVVVTMQKTTAAWNTTDKGWYLISSPVNTPTVVSVANGTYNMYYYDEPTAYWMNDKVHVDPEDPDSEVVEAFTNLTNGLGYLYRSTEENTAFSGVANVGPVDYTLSFAYDGDIDGIKGFNLIGNPYTHEIYKGVAIPAGKLETKYCILNTDGTWTLTNDNVAIAPMQAVLVQATSSGDIEIADNATAPGKYANDNIWFTVKNSEYTDVACVDFKEGHGFNKPTHRNESAPMLYVINNGAKFASACMPDDTKVINLGFEAKTMGQYTISLKAEGQYSYMHLIDKLTGEDIDMLVEDSYTFIGSQNDRNDRFVLRLNYNAASIDTESDIFAYQSGNDIVVSGEGELQVFDITGRKVMTMNVNGVETINGMNNGVYIFRMEGKTQKIVVR